MRQFLFIFSFAIISLFSFSKNIEGKWKFDYILPDSVVTGENLKPISEGDAIQINKDGSFPDYNTSNTQLSINVPAEELTRNWTEMS